MGQRSRASLVGGFDRGLGAGFGAVKGLALATVLFMGVTLLYDIGYGNMARPTWLTASRPWPALHATRAALIQVIAERRPEARAAESPPQRADPARCATRCISATSWRRRSPPPSSPATWPRAPPPP